MQKHGHTFDHDGSDAGRRVSVKQQILERSQILTGQNARARRSRLALHLAFFDSQTVTYRQPPPNQSFYNVLYFAADASAEKQV